MRCCATNEPSSESDITCEATVIGDPNAIWYGLGSITGNATVVANGYIIGEEWSPVTPGSESWNDVTPSSDTWTEITAGASSWTDITPSSDTWTASSSSSNTWELI